MKKAFAFMLFFFGVILVKAQRWGNHHHYPQQNYSRYCPPPRVIVAPRFGCGVSYRRPLLNVVIAPRPRVVVAPDPVYNQPKVERIWIEGHYEETQNGRIWVEGHYIQREIY